MKDVTLTDSVVEQLKKYQKSGEGLSSALRRLLDEAEPVPSPSADELSESVLLVEDLKRLDEAGYSPREYLVAEFDVDPADFNGDEIALREALADARDEGRE